MSDLALPPVIAPGETMASMTDTVSAIVLRERAHLWWWLSLLACLGLLGLGAFSLGYEMLHGVRAWGNDWPVVWGFPIINYVWWIGIASGGTFISALFFLLRVQWRTSLNRIAETMTLFAAACAGIYPIIHLGRPWFFYWLFPYPNTMGLWPQFRSPLFWDFAAIFAYVFASILFWFFGLLPDLATLRDRARHRGAQLAYGILAMGFRGSGRQWRDHQAVYGVLAAIMAPLVVSVHSIVGLDFAGAATTGWHSTQFPPFFVFGAIHSGFAMVLLLALPMRRFMGLAPYITLRHIDILARLMLTTALCVAYAYVMDAFSTFYGQDRTELVWFMDRITGAYAPVYWATLLLNCAVPQVLWFASLRRRVPLVALVSAGVVVGMWLERFGIVIDSLHRTQLPSAWGLYTPTFWDWSLFAGTIGLFGAGLLLSARLLPMVAMSEMRELIEGKR